MAKRGYGEGGITERTTKKGEIRYLAQFRAPGGKRLNFTAKTKKEAQTWLRKAAESAEQGTLPNSGRMTVAQFLERWLEAVSPSLRPRTIEGYRWLVHKYMIPTLGDKRLSALRADHLAALYSQMVDSGLSARTARHCHNVLHRALLHAVKWGLLARNVADAVEPPKPERFPMHTLNAEHVRQLLEAAEGEKQYCFIALAIATGMRKGELMGLRWSDINWDTKTINISRTLARVKGAGVVYAEPKSASGRRQVDFSQGTFTVLKRHRQEQLEWRLSVENWEDHNLVFPSERGTPMSTHSLDRQFDRILKKAGLPHIRIHDLRHTSASLMLVQKVHPKIVQERLGHSGIAITIDLYSHTIPGMGREAAKDLEEKMGLK